jgi:CubicO group peptidase (beta-lactamase class C family)
MTRRLRIAAFAVACVAAVTIAIVLGVWLEPPSILRVGANYAAKMVCSNVFLAGRDPEAVLREDVQSPGSPILRFLRVSVDRPHRTVRAGLFGFLGDGRAVAREHGGCAVVPQGAELAAEPKATRRAAATETPSATDAAPDTAASTADAPSATGVSTDAATAPAAVALWPEGERVELDAALAKIMADDRLTGPATRAVVVVHHGRLVGERYAPGFDERTPQLGWSMTKTVTAGLVGVLIAEGRLSLERKGFWPPGDGREDIRVADLLSMTSGLAWNEGYGTVSDVTRMLYLEPDMAGYARAKPLAHPPGSAWDYSSGSAVVLARIAQDAAGSTSSDLARDLLFRPLGMRSAVMEADARGTLVGSSYMYATPRDWARYGQFLLQQGWWHGHQILPPGYVHLMTMPVAASHGQYGEGLVWLWGSDPVHPGENPDAAFGIPKDTFWLLGHDNQFIAVIPSRELVIVRLGLTPARTHYRPQPLVRAVLEALTEEDRTSEAPASRGGR